MNADDSAPDEAFAQLGNETRIRIVQALGDADEPLRVSALKDRVGTRDSGQFNYHLEKLVGTFVQKTADEAYELTYAGHQVIGALLAGEFERQGSGETFALDSTCGVCGSAIEATYEDERVEVRCPSCDELLSGFGFPPGGLEGREPEALTATFHNWVVGLCRMAVGGICFNCLGPVTGSLSVEDVEVHRHEPVHVTFRCGRCSDRTTMSVNSYLVMQAPVIAFCYEHGIDVFEGELWNLPFLREGDVELASADPLLARSTIELEGERLTLVVEEDLSVRVV